MSSILPSRRDQEYQTLMTLYQQLQEAVGEGELEKSSPEEVANKVLLKGGSHPFSTLDPDKFTEINIMLLTQIQGSEKTDPIKLEKLQKLRNVITAFVAKQYEAQVDDFLKKLVAQGYQGDTDALKRSIIDEGSLELTGYKITNLPPEIGNLHELKKLKLAYTRLTSLPPEIEKLSKLVELSLTYSSSLSMLPPGTWKLRTLEVLDLSNTKIVSLPPEIGALSELKKLELAYVPLTSLPPEIGKLSKLQDLNLSGTQLTSLPPEIWMLEELQKLNLRIASLTSLPPEIGMLRKLQELDLGNTQLTSLPPEIGKLNKLELLSLGRTPFTSLPPEIWMLHTLLRLVLWETQLTSLPPEIGNLNKLQFLNLDHTLLTNLPPEIGKLSELQTLYSTDTQLTSVPREVINLLNLQIFSLEGTPISLQGDETTLGRQELRAHFGNRVGFTESTLELMPANTTQEEIYKALDEQPVRINRERFKNTKMPEIPGVASTDGRAFLAEFQKVLDLLNFTEEAEPGYLSHELLAGDFASDARPGTNKEQIYQNVLLRLTGYFKTLYDLSLDEAEIGGWQMYEDKKPALKKALSFIIAKLKDLEDAGERAALFTQLVDGLLHCPTGQKEGVDTVVLALLEQTTARSSDLRKLVSDIMAIKKNAFFKTAILTKGAENRQNVHLISSYEEKLQSALGLSNVLDLEERIGTFGQDPFNNNPANVLKVFYDLVTPNRLVDWVMGKTPSHDDLMLRQRLGELEKRRDAASASQISLLTKQLERLKAQSSQDNPTLKAQIGQLERMLETQKKHTPAQTFARSAEERLKLQGEIAMLQSKIRANNRFKPISVQVVIEYLVDNKLVNTDSASWWQGYFSVDPAEEPTALLTSAGAMKLLTNLGYVVRP